MKKRKKITTNDIQSPGTVLSNGTDISTMDIVEFARNYYQVKVGNETRPLSEHELENLRLMSILIDDAEKSGKSLLLYRGRDKNYNILKAYYNNFNK